MFMGVFASRHSLITQVQLEKWLLVIHNFLGIDQQDFFPNSFPGPRKLEKEI
jgi:hypothetical protein